MSQTSVYMPAPHSHTFVPGNETRPSSPRHTPVDTPFEHFAHKMALHNLPPQLIRLFSTYYEAIVSNHTGYIPESEILPIGKNDLHDISELEEYAEAGLEVADQFVAIKLNGGLGTSMGMTFAKSLVPVRGNLTFLDVILQQAVHQMKNSDTLPLAFMNSFSTHGDTLDTLREVSGLPALPLCFTQHKFPKVHKGTLLPATYREDPENEWNPPGHGDIYAALVLSGTLDTLLKQGRRYAFISNSDNLGATFNPRLLGYVAKNKIPFLMEVAPRTPSDRKGGHLARLRDGGLVLRELAQCPEMDLPHFQNIDRYELFNTNNIWIDLKALKQYTMKHGLLRLPMILNPKTVNPNDPGSSPVVQVETAMGAAISSFPGARAVVTSRDRFIPVKKCSDLLVTMSDCYVMRSSTLLTPNPERALPPITVSLDDRHYKTYDQLQERFPNGAPSLLHCRSLQVTGDIVFSAGSACVGDVTITNNTPHRVVLPSSLILQGDIQIG